MRVSCSKEASHGAGDFHRTTDCRERGIPAPASRAPGPRPGARSAQARRPALGGPAMANERAEEAEADGQRPDGGHHPARSFRRHGLTKSRAGASRGLSHLSPEGAARMVDVSDKRETVREAVARAVLKMAPATLRVIRRGNAPKGDVLGVARTAGILAAKRDRKSTRLNSSH